jgi:tetratricopeptide (TPR) repeat protein
VPLLPFFVLGAAAGIFTAWIERSMIGAEGADYEMTLLERGLLAGRVIWFYIGKLLWPANLIFIYPRWQIDPSVWWQWLFPVATVGVTVGLALSRPSAVSSGPNGKRWRAPLAAWLFFCGTLFPVLGFLNVYPFIYSFVADHFQYLASLGMIVLAAAAVALAIARLPEGTRRLAVAGCVVVVGVLAVLTSRQSRMYADAVTLYTTTLARNPNCWMAYNNLGSELQARGDTRAAMEHFRAALRINPRSATAYNNLGNALKNANQLEEAIASFRKALSLKPDNPVILNNLAAALVQAGKLDEARGHLENALKLRPNYAEAHLNLGLALALSGHLDEAGEQFGRASDLNPKDPMAENNFGLFLARDGKLSEAVLHFGKALRMQPQRDDIRSNLAGAMKQTGHVTEAIEHYQIVLARNPSYVQAHAGLAQALAAAGQSDQAIATARHAIELARSANQPAVANEVENWLKAYQNELSRSKPRTP